MRFPILLMACVPLFVESDRNLVWREKVKINVPCWNSFRVSGREPAPHFIKMCLKCLKFVDTLMMIG